MINLEFSGLSFGLLRPLSIAGKDSQYHWLLLLECACGKEVTARLSDLKRGKRESCGCQSKGHGMTNSKTYKSWQAMKTRCLNESATNYGNYGGRGVKIHPRWLESFENFFEDMGERPRGMTLDRINPHGHYEPSNCRWATAKQQAMNKRCHHGG